MASGATVAVGSGLGVGAGVAAGGRVAVVSGTSVGGGGSVGAGASVGRGGSVSAGASVGGCEAVDEKGLNNAKPASPQITQASNTAPPPTQTQVGI